MGGRRGHALLLLLSSLLLVQGCDAGAKNEATEKSPAPLQAAELRAPTTRMLAWQLGARMVEAAISHAGATTSDAVRAQRLEAARETAAQLGVTLPPLPERSEPPSQADAARALAWLLEDAGPKVGTTLAARHGADHEALFKVELLASVNVLLYQPGSARALGLAERLAADVEAANLQVDRSLEVLVGLLRNGAPAADVQAALDAFEDEVARQLIAEAER